MRKYNEFEDWISGAQFYIGYNRYGYIERHGFIAASCYDENEELLEIIEDMSGGDYEAFDAVKKLTSNAHYKYACDPSPAKAMQKLEEIMREWQKQIINQLEGD